jgi:nucleotidyltransferase AbiEii toxin of type IV toxin-antitoxin system
MRSTDMNSNSVVEKKPFLSLPDEERKEILQTLSSRRGRNPAVLEKDVWVCWALKTLFEIPKAHPMAFKGGTSLSKVYGIIERFSEDIDVTLDYKALLPTAEPFKEGISRTHLSKLTATLRELVSKHTHEVILPAFAAAINEQFGDTQYEVRLSDDGDCLTIAYRPLFQATYITDRVLVEFGGRNAITPTNSVTIKPYIADDLNDLLFPNAAVPVLAAERTFWEKATLIHVECNTESIDKLARKSRHWYDVYKLSKTPIGDGAMKDKGLLIDVVRHKQAFFYTSKARYEDCLNGGLRLVPANGMLKELAQDLKRMQDEGMFHGAVPSFDAMIEHLRSSEHSINRAFEEPDKSEPSAESAGS